MANQHLHGKAKGGKGKNGRNRDKRGGKGRKKDGGKGKKKDGKKGRNGGKGIDKISNEHNSYDSFDNVEQNRGKGSEGKGTDNQGKGAHDSEDAVSSLDIRAKLSSHDFSSKLSIHVQKYDRSDFEGKGGKGGKGGGKGRERGGIVGKGGKGGKGGGVKINSASEDIHSDDGYERFDNDAGKGSGGSTTLGSGKGIDRTEDSVS